MTTRGLTRAKSDSDESTISNGTEYGMPLSNGNGELSIVAEFDELMRLLQLKRNAHSDDAIIHYVTVMKDLILRWNLSVAECQRLQGVVEQKARIISDLESNLQIARKLLDSERKLKKKAVTDRDELMGHLKEVRDVLSKEPKRHIPDETREKFSFLKNRFSFETEEGPHEHLTTIQEVNTTVDLNEAFLGSLLSDFSYSRSEDDLDESALFAGKAWKKHRKSGGHVAEPALKKRRASETKVVEINTVETVRATTTLEVVKDGGITATSVIESIPPGPSATKRQAPQPEEEKKWREESPQPPTAPLRQHNFQAKITVIPEMCGYCNKWLRFGKSTLKCNGCRVLCHPECKDNMPLPCVPNNETPNKRHIIGYIGDFTPTTPPMVPALVIHCLNEIENRGLNEIGIYRIPGSEREVKDLKERLFKAKTTPCLNQVDIHVVCGVVKDFLRSLHEPLVTYKLWRSFVRAVEATDPQDVATALMQTVAKLPQPNRDTLAYMILHFRRIDRSPHCKMPIENLAKVFGPTIVGYSSPDLNPASITTETWQQVRVMEQLIRLPMDYWSSFINVNNNLQTPTGRLQQTPSTDSLLTATAERHFMTPGSKRTTTKRRKNFFATPPNKK